MRLALIVEYEGTDYHGFQYQKNARSIQEELEKAIQGLTGDRPRVKGAGRTDAGVHARGQVVAFDTESTLAAETFVRGLNFHLPDDIAVKRAYEVTGDFDPRRMATSRLYRYTIDTGTVPSPLIRRTSFHIGERLDIDAIRGAAALLAGTHDFARLAGPLADQEASTVRKIYQAQVSEEQELLELEVEGNAFLPHQVRRMAGAVVDVGRGRLHVRQLRQLVDNQESEAVARTLPARGLCLMQVKYADFPPDKGDSDGNVN